MHTKSPTLRRHKRSGHAYARFDGRQLWFGPYDDPKTHEAFGRTLAEWLAHGKRLPPSDDTACARVADIVAAYLQFAARHYCRSDGSPSREVANLTDAVRHVLKTYGTLPANEFGLRQLKTVREQMIDHGLARKTINDRINRIVRVFGWAAGEELCRPEIHGALRALGSLRRGRSRAREGRRVLPVAWEQVEATIPHLSRPTAGVVELMWHTGMRPGEAVLLRPVDLDRSGEVWLYRPQAHKTEYLGRDRVVTIGPRGQAVLRRFLSRLPLPAPEMPVFSPRDAMSSHYADRRLGRNSPLWPSHERCQARKRRAAPEKQPGDAYTANSLLGAVKRACKAAGIPPWSPNQLRHAAATRIRKEMGLEAARTVLGHASSAVTEIYAEADVRVAAQVMARMG